MGPPRAVALIRRHGITLLLVNDIFQRIARKVAAQSNRLSMMHLKQRRDGSIVPAICEGDVDWAAELEAVKQINYCGPFLFEIAPHENVWEYLEGSRVYLERLGLKH